MNNDKKANEIASIFVIENVSTKNELIIREMLKKSAMEMAKWKDEQYAKENKWISVEDKLPKFVTTEDGSQYSKSVFCKEECGSYCVARFARWQTGHYMWLDSYDEQPNVKYWREIKD